MSAATWEKLPALPGKGNPCLCCPPIPAKASMDKIIAVGFGSADVTRDGELVLDGEHSEDGWITFAHAEALAALDPDHDWRATLFGPLHGEVYQRHGPGEWMLVEKNEGFA